MNRRDFLKILALFTLSPKKIYAQKIKSKEAVVVGAGIIGSSIAYELSKRGVKVTLIDKNAPGSACSGSSFSWINACLLYTSPSPRDGLLSRMPSSA